MFADHPEAVEATQKGGDGFTRFGSRARTTKRIFPSPTHMSCLGKPETGPAPEAVAALVRSFSTVSIRRAAYESQKKKSVVGKTEAEEAKV